MQKVGRSPVIYALFATVAAFFAATPALSQSGRARALADALSATPEPFLVHGDRVPMLPLRVFYHNRDYRLVWTAPGAMGGSNERGRALLAALRDAAREGLDPDAYAVPHGLSGAALEIFLSAALLRYASDVRTGRSQPRRTAPELFLPRKAIDPATVLLAAAAVPDVTAYLQTLSPAAPDYRALRRALAEYRAIAANGGWPMVPVSQTIKPGYAGPGLAALRVRLQETGDLDPAVPPDGRYDGALQDAVIRFQRRHGLTADGVIGAHTFAVLNEPVARRIRQIEINMERWRWMPEDLGERHVFVNLAGFDLRAVRGGETVEAMPVIVGRPYRSTPVFSDRISYLEVNPNWTVPYKIATQDILPKLRAEPDYLKKNGFQVLLAGSDTPVDPAAIDWRRYGARNFPFQLRQLPGPTNALGRIKFMFPNRFAVYLHDTPARALFQKDVRMFSSGCIRVAEPMALAHFLLDGDPAWTPDRLHREVETGERTVIRLRRPVPVHLSYLTAWVAADGTVQFRADIYGRDRKLMAALYRGKAE